MFQSLDQVLTHAQHLHMNGWVPKGSWNLAQTCHHLTCWMTYPVEGFPPQPWFVRLMLGAMRLTVGKRILTGILATGKMRPNTPTTPETVAPPNLDVDKAIQNLQRAIQAFTRHNGPIHPSPLFGAMDKETALRLQLVHAAHHFANLAPAPG